MFKAGRGYKFYELCLHSWSSLCHRTLMENQILAYLFHAYGVTVLRFSIGNMILCCKYFNAHKKLYVRWLLRHLLLLP